MMVVSNFLRVIHCRLCRNGVFYSQVILLTHSDLIFTRLLTSLEVPNLDLDLNLEGWGRVRSSPTTDRDSEIGRLFSLQGNLLGLIRHDLC